MVQKSKDRRHARRAHTILLLHEGYTGSEVSRLQSAARQAVQDWRKRFEWLCEVALVPESSGRETVTDEVCRYLLELIEKSPDEYGYLQARWTSEMLAEEVQQTLGIFIHASTVRRVLPKLGVKWKRAQPTLQIPDLK